MYKNNISKIKKEKDKLLKDKSAFINFKKFMKKNPEYMDSLRNYPKLKSLFENFGEPEDNILMLFFLFDIYKFPKCTNCSKEIIILKESDIKYKSHDKEKLNSYLKNKITCCNSCRYKKSFKNQRKTLLEKYGVEFFSQISEAKEKRKKTLLERYGAECLSQIPAIKEKKKQTMLERYGVDNIAKLDSTKEKKRKVCLERYGVDNIAKLDSTKEKKRKTMLEKYGVDHALKTEPTKEKKKQTMLERYGVDYPTKNKEIIKKMLKSRLKHQSIKELLIVENPFEVNYPRP
ncbi:MAG: hypothetical protein PHV15_14785 [Thomasclavelia ramosa]|nr:hypothetical protein [Thomasclavelia ramosa]